MDIKKEYISLIEDTVQYIRTGFKGKPARRSSSSEDEPCIESADDPALKKNNPTIRRSSASEPAECNSKEDDSQVQRDRSVLMREVEEQVRACKKCRLCGGRKMAVPGEGNSNADIVLIGEGPGATEDATGRPFVGKAGQLLTRMLASIQLEREDVYITNIVKCRPPGNRDPLPDEVQACLLYLERQIEIIQPLVIVCLGLPALKTLTGTSQGISRLRGTFQQYKEYPVLPTYHPAAVLRFPEKYRRPVWNDLKMLRDYYREVKK